MPKTRPVQLAERMTDAEVERALAVALEHLPVLVPVAQAGTQLAALEDVPHIAEFTVEEPKPYGPEVKVGSPVGVNVTVNVMPPEINGHSVPWPGLAELRKGYGNAALPAEAEEHSPEAFLADLREEYGYLQNGNLELERADEEAALAVATSPITSIGRPGDCTCDYCGVAMVVGGHLYASHCAADLPDRLQLEDRCRLCGNTREGQVIVVAPDQVELARERIRNLNLRSGRKLTPSEMERPTRSYAQCLPTRSSNHGFYNYR